MSPIYFLFVCCTVQDLLEADPLCFGGIEAQRPADGSIVGQR